MSHFYGQLQGNCGRATRCGTKNSGIWASAQSWTGSVTVTLNAVGDNEETWVTIEALEESGAGGHTMYVAPLADLIKCMKDGGHLRLFPKEAK